MLRGAVEGGERDGAFVCEGAVAAGEGAGGGGAVGGRDVAEDEEFDEGADEDYDGELAEEESLSEG